ISDTLDKRLEVVSVKVLVDGKPSNFKADIKDQTVKLVLSREQLSTIQGKEVNVEITAKILEGTKIETIPNKADIQLNDEPKIDSNEVTIVPPTPVDPNIVKDVEGLDHIVVEEGDNYN
ncbi:isopeptide-forming domain-containing fimbrial protein, partial [Bacillus cereus]|uniref:isopeptide-forming domain-containing fimbrial protein n=1 Tax=Bacillus cereus TaxID=1396 RepID=UPI003D185F39